MAKTNNYLMTVPLVHVDQHDLTALRKWKSTLVGWPKWLQPKAMIKELTVRILEVEIHLEAQSDGTDTPPQST